VSSAPAAAQATSTRRPPAPGRRPARWSTRTPAPEARCSPTARCSTPAAARSATAARTPATSPYRPPSSTRRGSRELSSGGRAAPAALPAQRWSS